MNIQWFPGHMNKTLVEIESLQKKADFVLYVLDSRAPFSCLNPKLFEVVGDKPIIFVLTKKDLADALETRLWIEYLSKKNNIAVAVNANNKNCISIIISAIEKVLNKKIEKDKNKGIKKIYRGMVVGIPNSGKSTLINLLCGQVRAKTGNKAGVTKNIQWVKLGNGYELLDTPGTLWPKIDDKKIGLNLAFIGSVKDEIIDKNDLALELIETLKNIAPDKLMQRYNLKTIDDSVNVLLEEICKNRGFLQKGGNVDLERGAQAVIDDFRKARIGLITLDKLKSGRQ